MRSKVRTEEEEVQEMESDDGEEEKESDEDERATWIRHATWRNSCSLVFCKSCF